MGWKSCCAARVKTGRFGLAGQDPPYSKDDPPPQDLPEHHPVADQAVERMPERGRAVLLVDEVAEPGESVAAKRCAEQPPRVPEDDGQHDRRDHQPGTCEVQAPAAAIGVLAEIVRIELAEAGEARWHGAHVRRTHPFALSVAREASEVETPALRLRPCEPTRRANGVEPASTSLLRQRDEFPVVSGYQPESAFRPVALGLLDALARRRDEIPPQVPGRIQ